MYPPCQCVWSVNVQVLHIIIFLPETRDSQCSSWEFNYTCCMPLDFFTKSTEDVLCPHPGPLSAHPLTCYNKHTLQSKKKMGVAKQKCMSWRNTCVCCALAREERLSNHAALLLCRRVRDATTPTSKCYLFHKCSAHFLLCGYKHTCWMTSLYCIPPQLTLFASSECLVESGGGGGWRED